MKRITVLLLSALSVHLSAFGQGSLTPPGAPAPTMKTLQQVEPRTPIASVPYTITQPGSYYLTTNLTCTACTNSIDGITIAAGGVTLDLNGFELVGVAGAGYGIITSFTVTNIAIRNGTVRGWGSSGVAIFADNSQVEWLRASSNGGNGIGTGSGGTISGCTAEGNGSIGIGGGDGSTISGCSALGNLAYGIDVGFGGTINDCAAANNGSDGIVGNTGSTITACSAKSNGGNGIFAGAGGMVSGCTSMLNTGDGINVVQNTSVRDNNCINNGNNGSGAGIHATLDGNRIDNNSVSGNDRGIQVDVGTNFVFRNTARMNPNAGAIGRSNYVFSGSQVFGPTNSLVAASGVITNQNPWANFSF